MVGRDNLRPISRVQGPCHLYIVDNAQSRLLRLSESNQEQGHLSPKQHHAVDLELHSYCFQLLSLQLSEPHLDRTIRLIMLVLLHLRVPIFLVCCR